MPILKSRDALHSLRVGRSGRITRADVLKFARRRFFRCGDAASSRASKKSSASCATTPEVTDNPRTRRAPTRIEQLAEDVIALLDALDVDRVHFCGLSMGGMIGMRLGSARA